MGPCAGLYRRNSSLLQCKVDSLLPVNCIRMVILSKYAFIKSGKLNIKC